jgi:hypothetical protein
VSSAASFGGGLFSGSAFARGGSGLQGNSSIWGGGGVGGNGASDAAPMDALRAAASVADDDDAHMTWR